MLLNRMLQTMQRIQNDRLQLPIFYESPFALRFEIGDPHLANDQPLYIRQALWRAKFLYDAIAQPDILLWVLYRTKDSNTEDIPKLLERFCTLAHLPQPAQVYQQETTDSDGAPLVRIFFLWDCQDTPPDVVSLLDGIIQTDFSGFLELASAVFFFDTQNALLFHLYDDRGLDIVAAEKQSLLELYQKCSNWLLDYDRKRMDDTFSDLCVKDILD